MEGDSSARSDPAMMEGCRRRSIPTSSRMSEFTAENSRDLAGDEETGSPGYQMAESMSTDWTDEKHSLYLNSMEELFVKQLYNHKYHLTDSSRQVNANTRNSSGQFKVLRGGSWQKINFERTQSQLGIAGESHVLSKNPWIQHFRSAGKHGEVTSSLRQENGSLCSQAVHLGGMKSAPCGVATSSKQLPVCQSPLLHQDSTESNSEVSDQNFVDEDNEGEKFSRLCMTKRLRTVVTNASRKYQVVPLMKSPVIVDLNEKCASLKKEPTHSDTNQKMWID